MSGEDKSEIVCRDLQGRGIRTRDVIGRAVSSLGPRPLEAVTTSTLGGAQIAKSLSYNTFFPVVTLDQSTLRCASYI